MKLGTSWDRTPRYVGTAKEYGGKIPGEMDLMDHVIRH